MKIIRVLTVLLAALSLISCASLPASVPSPTSTVPLTATITPQPYVNSSPTAPPLAVATKHKLPEYPINKFTVDHTYCVSPNVFLPARVAQGFSSDEIARALMELYLDYFNTAQAPDYCRVAGYVIDKVYYDERTPSLPLEPKGDFLRSVLFTINLVQLPTFWASWPGDLDIENSQLHAGMHVAVFREKDGYTMRFAFP